MNDKAKLDLSKTCKIIVAEQQMISAQLYFFGILVRHKEIMTFTLSLEYSRNQNHLTAIYSMHHSIARANLKKSKKVLTSTTTASKYIPKRPRICIN